jgi:hypothetical protein
MTFKEAFDKLQEQEVAMQVKLGDNATFLVIETSLVSFRMPLGVVLQLDDVLYVPSLVKNLLSVLAMSYLRCVTGFDDQQVIIKDCNEDLI